MLLFGALVGAFAIHVFFIPPTLTMGGMTGLASLLHTVPLLGRLPLGFFIFLLNVPIFLLGGFTVSRRFLIYSVIGTLLYSTMIDLTEPLMTAFYRHYLAPASGHNQDLFISSVLGGALYGLGLGLMLRAGFTTGGTDILAIVVRRYTRRFSLGQLIWVMDAMIIMSSAFVYRSADVGSVNLALYSSIAMFMTAKAVDLLLEGFDYKRTAFVISSEPERIAQRVLAELDRGMTGLKGEGKFTGQQLQVLFCVLSQEQIPLLKKIVRDSDERAFVFVMDTREVQGEGFEGQTF